MRKRNGSKPQENQESIIPPALNEDEIGNPPDSPPAMTIDQFNQDDYWTTILSTIRIQNPGLYALLSSSLSHRLDGEVLTIDLISNVLMNRLSKPENIAIVTKVASNILHRDISIETKVSKQENIVADSWAEYRTSAFIQESVRTLLNAYAILKEDHDRFREELRVLRAEVVLLKDRKGRIDYYEYIQSQEWRERATKAKERAGWRCQICNTAGDYSTLDAHHRTYERLGNEDPEDITVLCRPCHESITAMMKARK